MVSGNLVVGGVASAPDLMEELTDLGGDDALVFEPPEQIDLSLGRTDVLPDVGGYELCEQFSELAQLEQTGIGIVGEVAFCTLPQAHELFVVHTKVRKVAGQLPGFHSVILANVGNSRSEEDRSVSRYLPQQSRWSI